MSPPPLYEYVIACLTFLPSLVTCQEVNCSLDSPELWLRDVAGELHTFRENITEMAELRLQKGAAVSTRAGGGESLVGCCYLVTFTALFTLQENVALLSSPKEMAEGTNSC